MTINFSFLMIFALPLLAVGFALTVYAVFNLVTSLIEWVFSYGR